MNPKNNTRRVTGNIHRRHLLKGGVATAVFAIMFRPQTVWAKHYMDSAQAQKLIWGDMEFVAHPITLSKVQMKSIKKSSKTRVRNAKLNAWKSETGEWFILDQIIGKHENIDVAFGITNAGKIKGIEILEYRESYGQQIINPKWMAQFYNREGLDVLKLDKQIKNISGATLSCRHITDGVNRLTHTWDQVLRST